MLIVLAYDVDFTTENGAKRLRRVSKICCNYGIRVQNSVFELQIDTTQFTKLKGELTKVIDSQNDSIRCYILGNKWTNKIELLGKSSQVEQDDCMIF